MNYWLDVKRQDKIAKFAKYIEYPLLVKFLLEFDDLRASGKTNFKPLYKKYPEVRVSCRRAWLFLDKLSTIE